MDASSYDETRHDRRRARRPGPVLAAVDDSNLAAAVGRCAAEHARISGRTLVVVSVVPVGDARGLREGGQLPGGLDDYDDALAIARRVGPTLDELAVAYQLEIRGYLARGGPRRQARRIAATVLRVAGETGAEVIVVGEPRDRAPAGMSVSVRIAKGAPTRVLVLLEQPEPRRAVRRIRRRAGVAPVADHDLVGTGGVARAGRLAGDPSEVILTRQGRRLLAERAYRLRTHVLPELRAALDDRERDGRGDTEYERAVDELRRLSWLVEHAADAEELPDDPDVVELGETVTVQIGGGALERFLIVHPVEAPLDNTRISAHSPLARALLGRRIGDEVEVDAPVGTYRCRILAAERTPRSAARQVGTPRQPTEVT
ncbi:MAG TPA: GreA/GreB family elongation factor, partial [Actinomycetota bacterium]|nr:GreA/GreB family elongation factor [Actinomycetota bacterium]